ncbi:MAG: hypothetical protein WBN20_05710 [Eudoraea sp.]|uniref:hypothetical protein n=1 Tax=Eudoraea sp. TaxID=1979955 RepID=UPI003C769262
MYLSKNSTLLFAFIMVMSFNFNSFSQKQIQNVNGRKTLSLNGNWQFIIDPYKMGYLDYRQKPFDESESGKGGFYDNITNPGKTKRAEYNFDYEPTLTVPGDWNSQYEKL